MNGQVNMQKAEMHADTLVGIGWRQLIGLLMFWECFELFFLEAALKVGQYENRPINNFLAIISISAKNATHKNSTNSTFTLEADMPSKFFKNLIKKACSAPDTTQFKLVYWNYAHD